MTIEATYVSSNTFTVEDNQTIEFHAGRRVKLVGSTNWYGTIETSNYLAGNTTVTLTATSDNIDATLTEAYYGIVSGVEAESSMPIHTHDGDEGSGGQVDHEDLANKGSNTHLEIDTHITNSTNSIATISGSVDTNTANLSTLSGTVDNNTNSITTISGVVDSNTSSIVNNTNSISTISGTVDNNTSSIATISGAVDLNTTHRETVIGNPHQVTKAEVGLGNVPNTDFTSAVNNNTSSISTISGTVDNHSTKLDYITITQEVDLDTLESDVATNNAKETNATHTGDVTGSTELTIQNKQTLTASNGVNISNSPTVVALNPPALSLTYGSTANTVCEGNDSRLSDNRTPTSHDNTAHSENYITSTGVTYENLDANGDVGTVTGTVASGNDSRFHNRSHAITGTDDHTAGNWKVIYSNGSGEISELALSTSGTVLTSNGSSSVPSFTSVETGMAELVDDTSPQLGGDLDANNNAIVAADHGTATSPQVVNVVYGTGTAPTASGTTEGTLFIKYTV